MVSKQILVPSCVIHPLSLKICPGYVISHINAASLLPKLDMVIICADSAGADIIVVSETWMLKSITDKDVAIGGFTIFGADCPKKDGGEAMRSNSLRSFLAVVGCY